MSNTTKEYFDIPYEEKMRVRVKNDMIEFSKNYDALYESENLEDLMDCFWMGDKLIEYAEERMKTKEWKEYIKYWAKYWWDIIASDRELKALAITLYLNPYDYGDK